MILRPDLNTATVVCYGEEKVLSLICDIHLGEGKGLFAGDPRAVAKRAEQFLISEGIAEAVMMSA